MAQIITDNKETSGQPRATNKYDFIRELRE